jgi:CYTH domain-containing protein
MAIEIERKFLVKDDRWRSLATGVVYRQGYITASRDRTVRVRVAGDRGFLTIKGKSVGLSRAEFEYAIPLEDAMTLLDTLCEPPLIEKVRYRLEYSGLIWEIDEFGGENAGLILAEVELSDANQAIAIPDWIGEEVSHDPRYFNANLTKHPYCQWKQ